MLEQARATPSRLRWRRGDLAGWQPDQAPSLLFSSAVIQLPGCSRGLHDPGFYYDLLAADAAHLDVWTTEYLHALTGTDAVLEWVTATSLRPILAGLGDADRVTFLTGTASGSRAHTPRPDGITLYPFRRLFFVAVRG